MSGTVTQCPTCGDTITYLPDDEYWVHDSGTGDHLAHPPTNSDPIFCPTQTYRQTRDSPAEYCTEEVADYGDLCPKHEEDDRADEAYDAYKESRYDD
jgi:hypothetical protein